MNKIFVAVLVVVLLLVGISKFRSRHSQGSGGARYSRITASEAEALMEGEDVVIVDVRTAAEFSAGHIPRAINIPVESISAVPPASLDDRDATILVYCRSGSRSAQAARRLLRLGYTTVHDFGGINSWPGQLVR